MVSLRHEDYDRLERAVAHGLRVVVYRRGTEYIVIPTALTTKAGREALEARNPTTGDAMTLFLHELDSIEMVGW